MSNIRTVGDLRKLIQDLDDDYSIDFRVRTEKSEEELKNSLYPYPYKTDHYEGLEYDDIGVSDRELCLGITLRSKNNE